MHKICDTTLHMQHFVMAGKKGKSYEISEYLRRVISMRMARLGLSARRVAELLNEGQPESEHIHHGSVSRLLLAKGGVRSIKFLPRLREVLKLRETDLEKRYEQYSEMVNMHLAHVMLTAPFQTEEYLDTLGKLGSVYSGIAHTRNQKARLEDAMVKAGVANTLNKDGAAEAHAEIVSEYDDLTFFEGELDFARRGIQELVRTASAHIDLKAREEEVEFRSELFPKAKPFWRTIGEPDEDE